MEASAAHAPGLSRRPLLSSPLLRLRSDDQLVALVRAGSEDAFAVIHDRYRQRLFAYVRQMLSQSSRADAEDVLQDVFVRAYGALRADRRELNLRAWLYRVAHNRCIDHLRRPVPPNGDVYDMSRPPLQDPMETAQRRDDLKRLVDDVGRLPDQQRSALLMREIDGLAYADIAQALDVTVPAVKSLLVRARVGLVEAAEARDTDCAVIRSDLVAAYDRGVKSSARARRHMRECAGCREYRTALRGMRRSFAALTPAAALGPVALALKTLGGGGAAASGGAAATGTASVAGTGLLTAGAGKVAAVVCTAVVATGGAVEAQKVARDHKRERPPGSTAAASARAAAPAAVATAAVAAPRVSAATLRHRTTGPGIVVVPATAPAVHEPVTTAEPVVEEPAPVADAPATPVADAPAPAVEDSAPPPDPGGHPAPDAPSSGVQHAPSGTGATPSSGGTHQSPVTAAPATTEPVPAPTAPPGPPPEH